METSSPIPCMHRIFTYLHLVDFYGKLVGKYTSPMDAVLKITNGLPEDVERSRWTPYNKRHGKAPIFGDSMMTAVLHEDLFEDFGYPQLPILENY